MKILKIVLALAVVLGALWYFFVYPDYEVGTIDPESQVSPQEQQFTEALMGTWQSKEDASFTREFLMDGVVIDRYKGDDSATATSTWSLFTAEDPDPGATMPLQTGTEYLAIRDNDTEPYFFAIATSSPTYLSLIYLNRGGVQEYTRLK